MQPVAKDSIQLLNFLELYPASIKSLYVSTIADSQYLTTSRKGYSEIHRVVQHKDKIYFDEVLRLPECEHLLYIDGCAVLVGTAEVKMHSDGRWVTHPYSTQLTGLSVIQNSLYTFHDAQALRWDTEGMSYEVVGSKQQPYHLATEGIRGKGRVLKGKFSSCHEFQGYLYLGQLDGTLSIYETVYLTLVKKIKKHQGPILSIVSCESTSSVYASGCDSKIICVKQINEQFVVTSHCRGQSHDVTSLVLINDNTLLSGGLTTDLCYYPLKNGNFTGEYVHRQSLPSKSLVVCDSNHEYILVNQITHFELWRYVSDIDPEFIIRFETVAPITEIAISDDAEWMAYSNQYQTTIIKIDKETGALEKEMNIHPASFISFGEKNTCTIVATDLTVYSIKLQKKKVSELFRIEEPSLPSCFNIQENRLFVGSRLEGKLVVYDLTSGETVFTKTTPYHFAELTPKGLIFTYNFKVTIDDLENNQLSMEIPIRRVRFGGIVPSRKKYWYGVGDGRIVFVYRLFLGNQKCIEEKKKMDKTIVMRKIQRVFQVIKNKRLMSIVGINFTEMAQQIENPVITKKFF